MVDVLGVAVDVGAQKGGEVQVVEVEAAVAEAGLEVAAVVVGALGHEEDLAGAQNVAPNTREGEVGEAQ